MSFNAISFFSGGMGLDIGLEKAGFDVRLCVDFDKYCCETIRKNRPNIPVLEGRIEDYTSREILKAANLKSSEVFLLHGGPPCQAFSTAGGRKSLQDIRGNCVLEFVKKVVEIQPRYFIMENVRGLLSAAISPSTKSKVLLPEEMPGSVLRYVIYLFNEAGYTVSFALFDSANYGVPQKRERVIFFGNRGKTRIPLPQPTHSKDGAMGTKKWVGLKEALKHLNGSTKHEHVDFSENRKKYYRFLKAGQYWRHLPEELQEEAMGSSYHLGGGKTGFYRRLSWEVPAPTLVTRPNMPATDLCHPDELRPLSVQEYKAIQQFPQDWWFAGNIIEQYKQIGNAVPVGLGRIAGKTIIDFHTGKTTKEEQNVVKYSRYNGTTDIDFEGRQLELAFSK